MLSADDQERFARHLLLDAFGGAGQERLCAGAVEIDLPASFSSAASSCARALAAAGVGALTLRGPWAARAAEECQRLAPSIALGLPQPGSGEIVSDAHEAARRVIVCNEHEAAPPPSGPLRVTLPREVPASPAEASALGALAALEAMKLLGRAGEPAPLPLFVFPVSARGEAGFAPREEAGR